MRPLAALLSLPNLSNFPLPEPLKAVRQNLRDIATQASEHLGEKLSAWQSNDPRFSITPSGPNTLPVVIIGAGPCGLSMAAALADAGITSRLIEQASEETLVTPQEDGREIALTHRGVAILQKLGAWENLRAEEISPLKGAEVYNTHDPVPLNFFPPTNIGDKLGYIVSNQALRRIAYQGIKARSAYIDLQCGLTVKSLDLRAEGALIVLSNDQTLRAQLVIAADSRFSTTRRMVGISTDMLDFGRSVILCRLRHEKSNSYKALECFNHGHTMAWLPLEEHVSSLVLTVNNSEVNELLRLDDKSYLAWVSAHAQQRLGKLTYAEQNPVRHHFPLIATFPERFLARRFVLAGDAAVGMHPVTAHGYNFGLYSVETLVTQLRTLHENQSDLGSPDALMRYHWQHRLATELIYRGTNAVVRLFTDDRPLPKKMRAAVIWGARKIAPLQQVITHQLISQAPRSHATLIPK